jgi:predicted lipoprotein with Yx(FWY)xxD motif
MRIMTLLHGASMLLLLSAVPAYSAGVLTDPKGRTLYVSDKDTTGTPTCEGTCAQNWPPYLGKAGAKLSKGWTLVKRSDGAMQWAYDGRPTYYFAGDKKKNDKKGDGMMGTWHVLAE